MLAALHRRGSCDLEAEMLTWDDIDPADTHPLTRYQIIRRNGAVVPFEPSKIANVMMKAFLAVSCHGAEGFLCSGLHAAGSWMVAFMSWHMHHLPMSPLLRSRVVNATRTRLNGFFWSGKANLRNAP